MASEARSDLINDFVLANFTYLTYISSPSHPIRLKSVLSNFVRRWNGQLLDLRCTWAAAGKKRLALQMACGIVMAKSYPPILPWYPSWRGEPRLRGVNKAALRRVVKWGLELRNTSFTKVRLANWRWCGVENFPWKMEKEWQRHGCQMAIAGFLDRMCLALQASGLWLRYAAKFVILEKQRQRDGW